MARWTQVRVDTTTLRSDGAPVSIEAHALLRDEDTGSLAAQVRLHNASKKPIASLALELRPVGQDGAALAPEPAAMDGLSAPAGADFGQDRPLALLTPAATDVSVAVTSVTFADGSSWTAAPGARWEQATGAAGLIDSMRTRGTTRRNVMIAAVAAAVVVAVLVVVNVVVPSLGQLGSDPGIADMHFTEFESTDRKAMLACTYTNTSDKTDTFVVLTSLELDGRRAAIGFGVTDELGPGETDNDVQMAISDQYNGLDFDSPLSSSMLPRTVGLLGSINDADASWAWDDDHSFAADDDVRIGRTIVIPLSDMSDAARRELND